MEEDMTVERADRERRERAIVNGIGQDCRGEQTGREERGE